MFGTYLHSKGTHHKNFLTMSRVTHFIPQAHTDQGEDLETNESEWTGKAGIRTRKKFLAAGKAGMVIFWPAPGFKMRTFWQLWVLSRGGTLISAFALPHCGYRQTEVIAEREMEERERERAIQRCVELSPAISYALISVLSITAKSTETPLLLS